MILPAFLTKLKISINGYESEQHFEVLAQLPSLKDLHITLDDQYHTADEEAFLALFTLLGSKLKGIRNLNPLLLPRFADFIVDFAPNLRELGIPHQLANGSQLRYSGSNGSAIAPIFQSPTRAAQFTRLQLGIESLCQTVLICMADYCHRLTSLDLAYCQYLDDTIMSAVANNCRSTLKILDISACPLLTDLTLIFLAESCGETLEEISLFQTRMTDRAIVLLVQNCSQLRVLGVSQGVISLSLANKIQRNSLHNIIG